MKSIPIFLLPLFFLLFSGCDNRINVTGNVKFEDGTPLHVGIVLMQKGGEAMQGAVNPDGSFSMGKLKSGEGIQPGVYQVGVSNAQINLGEDLIDPKWSNPSTSGLSFEVAPGQNNHCEIVVTPPGLNKNKRQ